MDKATDRPASGLTVKALERAWKSIPARSPSPWDNWQACFFLRVSFVRVLWSLRKSNHDKYLKVRNLEWNLAMNAFRPHRKTWNKKMRVKK